MAISRSSALLFGVSLVAVSAAQAQSPPAAAPAATLLPPVTVAPPRPAATARPSGESSIRRAATPQRPLGRTTATEAAPARPRAVAPVPMPVAETPIPLPPTQLDEISTTSTKTERPAIDTLGGASVVSQEQIRRIQPGRISDILRDIPGVTTQEQPNDPGQAINIRGLQDFGRVNVLVDGARQNFQVTGHGASGTFFLDPELIGGIDVTRGPVSTIYGSGAIGGVVAFRTKGIDDLLRPDEMAGAEQRMVFGTNGYGAVNSTSGGFRTPNNAVSVFGQFLYRDSYAYKDGGGRVVPDTGRDLVAGNMKLVVNPAEGHQLTATALLQNYDFTNNFQSQNGSRFQNELQTDTYTLGYRFNPSDNPLFDLNAKVYHSTTNSRQTLLQGTTTYTQLGARPGNQIRVNLETDGFDVYNTSRFDTGPVSHALTIGGDGVFDKVRTTDNAGGYVAAFTPGGTRSLLGAFVQDEMRYGGWLRAVVAARYDSYELKGAGLKSEGDRISPRGTLGISPFPWLEIYGTYAEGYRAPAVSEAFISGTHPFPAFQILANPSLRPETAHNVEGGVNIKFDNVLREGDTFRGKVVGFVNSIDNYIGIGGVGPTFYRAVVPSVVLNGLCAGRTAPFGPCQIPVQNQQYTNIPKAELSGVEMEAAYDWVSGFASLAYSYTEGENKATGQTLLSIPPAKIAGTLGLRFLDNRLILGTRIIYNDARNNFVPNTTIVSTKQYTLVDLFASYKHNDWVSADVTLTNIFDVRYQRYLDLERSPGFGARGGLTFKFATR